MSGVETRARVMLALLLFWVASPALSAEDGFFEGALRLPRFAGFQRLAQPEYATQRDRWVPEGKLSGPAVAYMLANPTRKLWITVRRAKGDSTAPLLLSELQNSWKSELQSQGFRLPEPEVVKWAPGEGCLYKVMEDLGGGHRCFFLFLRPTRKSGPPVAYVFTVVYADGAAGEARKLVNQLLKKAAVD